MKKILSLVLFLGFGTAAAMDDEPDSEELSYEQEKALYCAHTVEELNQIIDNKSDPLLLKKVLLVLVERPWTNQSALKINHLLEQINTLDSGGSLVRFDDAQVDIMGYLIENHKPARGGLQNTYLPDWIAWFVQRGVAVDALSDTNSVGQEGHTPLVWAVFYKRQDVVLRLLQLGAQVSTVNKPKRERPFTVLERFGDSEDPEIIPIVKLLKNYPHITDLPADTTIQNSNPEPTAPAVTNNKSSSVSTLPASASAPTTPAVVTPTQPQPKIQNTSVASMPHPQRLIIAGGVVLALYAGYRWLKKQPTEIEEDDAQDEISEKPLE